MKRKLFVVGIALFLAVQAYGGDQDILAYGSNRLKALFLGLKAAKKSLNIAKIPMKRYYITKKLAFFNLEELIENTYEYNILSGHSDDIRCVKFSSDGNILASGSNDRTVKLWSVENGVEICTFQGEWDVFGDINFSSDDKTLYSASSGNGMLIINQWDIERRKELRKIKIETDAIFGVNISPDSKMIASYNHDDEIKLWNTENGNEIKTIGELFNRKKQFNSRYQETLGKSPPTFDRLKRLIFSPDNKLLASGSNYGVILWNIDTGLKIGEFNSKFISNFHISPDSKTLIVSCSVGIIPAVVLWDIEHGKEIQRLVDVDTTNPTHLSTSDLICFSPNSKYLVSSRGKNITIWYINDSKKNITLKGHSDLINSIHFTPDSRLLASGSKDHSIRLWSIQDNIQDKEHFEVEGHQSLITAFDFSPDGRILASGCLDTTIKLWDVKDKKEIMTLNGHLTRINSICFSPDGNFLASGSGKNPYGGNLKGIDDTIDDNTIKLWDIKSMREIKTLKGHSQGVTCIKFNPKGERIVSGSYDNTIKLWDVEKGIDIITLKGHNDHVMSVDFSSDGKIIASGSWDNTIKLWDSKTGKEIKTLSGHTNKVNSVLFSPDDKILVSGSSDKTIKLWNIQNDKEVITLDGYSDKIEILNFSSDGKTLSVQSEDRIELWDIENKMKIRVFQCNCAISHFSKDGKILASAYNSLSTKRNSIKLKVFNIDDKDILIRGCKKVQFYLKSNPEVSKEDRCFCDDILK